MIGLPQLSYATRRRINRFIWRFLQQLAEVVHPVPALSAFLLLVLLAYVGQLHEIYLSYLEPPFDAAKAGHIALALLALALISSALFYANHALSTIRIDVIYSQTGNYTSDVRLKLLRNGVGCLSALAPWVGLALGLRTAAARAREHVDQLFQAVGPFQHHLAGLRPEIDVIAAAPPRLQLASWLAVLLGAGIVYLLYRTRQYGRFRAAVIGVGVLALVLVLLAPSPMTWLAEVYPRSFGWLGVDAVPYYRAFGPLAMVLIVSLGLVAILAVLAFLSGQIGFPLVPVAFVLAILAAMLRWPMGQIVWSMLAAFLVIAVLGALSRRWPLAVLSALLALFTLSAARQLGGNPVSLAAEDASRSARQELADGFASWLAGRKAEREAYVWARGKPYPVFIIAAQGGGIYAAAAAAAFLSRLQDRCPSFAQHVFVISGVSGGAVGASVFQSMMQARQREQRGCLTPAGDATRSLAARTSAVVQDDHLSPLLGMLPADLLGLQRDRAVALEQSFVASVERRGGGTALGQTFDKHWQAAGDAPALLLNATWVETGYRVAFAPFRLGGMRDGTLYAFGDPSLAAGGAGGVSLAGAAVVSARFPGVVPAFSFDRPVGKKGEKGAVGRWNFVDGGYADESGSATALEVYKALEPRAAAENVDLRLILLTDARPEPSFDTIDGTVARDLLAPALTVLKVRDLLSRQAIMRTISEVERDTERLRKLQRKQSAAQLGRVDDWKATVVELDHESFTLALGWKMSNSTHTIVSLLLGRDELCIDMADNLKDEPEGISEALGSERPALRISAKTIRANSCVMHAIVKLVSPS